VFYALAITFSVLGAYLLGTQRLGLSEAEGNNLTFYALSLAQVLHVFNLHSERSFFNNEITRNRYIWYATALCLFILVLTYYVPFLRQVLSLQPMRSTELGLIVVAAVVPVLIVQLVALARGGRTGSKLQSSGPRR
jgi:Ca2+-transporting ATPase